MGKVHPINDATDEGSAAAEGFADDASTTNNYLFVTGYEA
jgi:hypothetical protein